MGGEIELSEKELLDLIARLKAENARLKKLIDDAPVALMDTRDFLGLCAIEEKDFPALYALQGKRVRIVVDGD